MLRSLILSFIPESLRQDADEFRRARLLVTVSFTLMVLSLLSIVQDLFFVGFTLVDIPMLFAAVITAFTPTLMKQSASLKQLVSLLVGTYIVVITILFFSFGGIKSNTHYFFIAAPILAFNLGGFKFGRTVGIGIMLLVIGLFVLEINAIVPLPPIRIPPQQIVYITLTSTVFLVLFINSISAQSELSKEETTELLSETRAESERKAQEDYHKLEEMKAESERRAAQDLARSESQKEYLTKSVEELLQHIRRVAEGDFTVRVPESSTSSTDDNIGKLAHALNQTIENVEAMLARVAESADRTVYAASEISSATEGLTSSSQKQSSQAGHVASAVEEMSATIEQTTQQTSLAAHEASLANDDAQQGNGAMQSMMENVRSISNVVIQSADKISALGRSSEQIGEIIQVIDEIADQTNLLALNAAIEAARAGDAGRGFAVVADEVRKLAERTQKATKEISNTIKIIQRDTGEAVGSMQAGTRLVNEGQQALTRTADAFSAILQRTERVSDVMSQLATASEEQATTSNVMAQSVGTIADVIEESVQSVGNIAGSAQGLQTQAEELQQLIGQFRITRTQRMQGTIGTNGGKQIRGSSRKLLS
ncbi:MAG: HAMP domain-containing protein [Candidatus Kapabacteria bacterium]|nr:HAMP domain-containing protein [Candidatus Kapabacteria bacterium]